MVLEGATAESDLQSDELLPPSDSDPYASDSASPYPRSIYIDFTKLPRPAPIIGPLTGYTQRRTALTIQRALEVASKSVGRPLTKDEAEAIAHVSAKGVSITSWGIGLGGVLGLARCYQLADTFKFPIMKVTRTAIDPDKFGAWTGARARGAWHTVRGCAYVGIFALVGHTVFTSYAAATIANTIARDPRLRNIYETIAANVQRQMEDRRRAAGGAVPKGRGTREGERLPPVRSASDAYDMSRVSNNDPYASGSPGAYETQYGGAIDGTQAPPAPIAQRGPSQEPQFPSTYDDASPTARAEPTDRNTAGESAWERIRRDATAGTANRQPARSGTRTTDVSAPGRWKQGARQDQSDGLRYGSESRDRADAQEDFDARLERERRGESFSEDTKKW